MARGDRSYVAQLCGRTHPRPFHCIPLCACSEIPNIDAILLSHGELSHLGALPYLVAKCGLEAPVYSTGPTRSMGEMFLRETVQAKTVSMHAAAQLCVHARLACTCI